MPYAPEGNLHTAEIVFVGEAPAKYEIMYGNPLSGPSGWVFDDCLDAANISRSTCYITNVFDFMVTKDDQKNILDRDKNILYKPRSGFTEKGKIHIDRLMDELQESKADVICTLGNPALEALTGRRGIFKWRGSILNSSILPGRKVVPTIHPANSLHGQYINRYYIRSDFKRVKKQSEFPDIRRPPYKLRLFPSFIECISFLNYLLKDKPQVSVDIEVSHRQVSRISYGWSEYESISIPHGEAGWNFEEEKLLWLKTAEVLEDPDIPKIMQNGIFDIQFLMSTHHIHVPISSINDTMYAHHIVYPDFRAGLASMTATYTEQPYYKDMIKHGPIDKEDG
jgi:uracil-DNA glycosylase family 4